LISKLSRVFLLGEGCLTGLLPLRRELLRLRLPRLRRQRLPRLEPMLQVLRPPLLARVALRRHGPLSTGLGPALRELLMSLRGGPAGLPRADRVRALGVTGLRAWPDLARLICSGACIE
jgi:hypothetical protein